jgi:hypothetical protein
MLIVFRGGDFFSQNETKISEKEKECLVLGVYAHIKRHPIAHQ